MSNVGHLWTNLDIVITRQNLMLVSSKRTKPLHRIPPLISFGNANIQPKHWSIWALHWNVIILRTIMFAIRPCSFKLRRLTSIRRLLINTVTGTLVSAFVLSRIDYWNSLIFCTTRNLKHHLQWLLISAALVILPIPKSARNPPN